MRGGTVFAGGRSTHGVESEREFKSRVKFKWRLPFPFPLFNSVLEGGGRGEGKLQGMKHSPHIMKQAFPPHFPP